MHEPSESIRQALAGTSLCMSEGENGLCISDGGMQLSADFSDLKRRIASGRLSQELLVRAAKLKGFSGTPRILDATAGLGEDSFLLAAAGFDVFLYERNPVIAALLADAVERAHVDEEICEVVERMHVHEGDSVRALRDHDVEPDVVYLDPMFPERRKSAAVKKKFQLLQQLESPCDDAEELLQAALEARPKKIVIKRPIKGPYLGDLTPDYSLRGKAVRYDCIAISGG